MPKIYKEKIIGLQNFIIKKQRIFFFFYKVCLVVTEQEYTQQWKAERGSNPFLPYSNKTKKVSAGVLHLVIITTIIISSSISNSGEMFRLSFSWALLSEITVLLLILYLLQPNKFKDKGSFFLQLSDYHLS